jgi:hypothetical protein
VCVCVRVQEKAEKSAIGNERRESHTLAEERDCVSRFREENVALNTEIKGTVSRVRKMARHRGRR